MLGPLVLLMSSFAFGQDCPDGPDQLQGSAWAHADAILVDLQTSPEKDATPFLKAFDALSATMGCLKEVAPPDLSAAYHQIQAINTDLLGMGTEPDKAAPFLIAAERLAGKPKFRTELLGDSHPIRAQADALTLPEPRWDEVPAPAEGALFFDGKEATQRPADQATFFQRTNAEGQVVFNQLLLPSQELPGYPVPEPVAEAPTEAAADPEPVPVETEDALTPPGPAPEPVRKDGGGQGLRMVGLAGMAGGAALLGAGALVGGQALNGSTEDAKAKIPVVNGLTGAGAGVAVLGGTLLGVSFTL